MRKPLQARGQAMVETAIALPWFILMVLGVVQLTMLQHARLLTEYAAYSAARAGIVWNGDPGKMITAATVVLVPTMGESDSVSTFLGSYLKLLAEAPFVIKVTTLGPTKGDFGDSDEIDFDDPANRETTLLTVRVRYLYRLRIPFANSFIFESWLAGIGGSQVVNGLFPYRKYDGASLSRVERYALEAASAKWDQQACARSGVTLNYIQAVLMPFAVAGVYYLPVTATYSMRFQSNPFQKFAPPANEDPCSI